MTPDWFLTIEVSGRTFRFSSGFGSNGGFEFLPGLASEAIVGFEGETGDMSLSVVSRELQEYADDLDTGTARLDFFDGVRTRTISEGLIVGITHGAPDEVIGFSISRSFPGKARGFRVPDVTSRIDEDTWPDGTVGAEIGNVGVNYPVIFGYPGEEGAASPRTVVPAPLAQRTSGAAADSYFVVSEDSRASITSVVVRRQASFDEDTQTVSEKSDALGKKVLVADCSTGGVGTIPTTGNAYILVGYGASTGGGVARSLYDSIVYLLERWGGDSVDWAKIPNIQGRLEGYNVDSWVNDSVADPWVIVEHWLAHVPVSVRMGNKGLYLIEQRLRSDDAYLAGELRDGQGRRLSPVIRDGYPMNEVRALYRPDPENGWRGQVVIAGDKASVKPTEIEVDSDALIDHPLAIRSFSRYGRRQGPDLSVDWTWDQGTAHRIAADIIDRSALPGRLVDYEVPVEIARGWKEGDEINLSDTELNWANERAIIDGPIGFSASGALVSFRLPE